MAGGGDGGGNCASAAMLTVVVRGTTCTAHDQSKRRTPQSPAALQLADRQGGGRVVCVNACKFVQTRACVHLSACQNSQSINEVALYHSRVIEFDN